jgi:hypothetical protein
MLGIRVMIAVARFQRLKAGSGKARNELIHGRQPGMRH